MTGFWNLLGYLPPGLLTFVKRHTSSRLRFWLRQNLGGDYAAIPDCLWTVADGRRFHIGPDVIYWAIYHGLEFEPEATCAIRRLIGPGDVVIDAGANFGWYTTLCAVAVSPSGRVYAFEPVPASHARLMENLALNGLVEQVSPIRAALGATTGTTKIHMFKNLSASHASVSPLTRHDYELLEVPLIRVDEYLQSEGISNVHLLKCDVEGAELDVLIGCGDLLRSEVAPLILIELNTDTSAAMGFTKTDIWSYLNSVGYDSFFACEARGRVRQIRSVKEFMRLDLALCAKRTGLGERLDRRMVLGA